MHRARRLGNHGSLPLHPSVGTVLIGTAGLSAWLGWLDYVLLPLLLTFLALAALERFTF